MALSYIYALRDPFTLDRRYIGKAKNPCDRYRKHMMPYYLRPDTYKNRWLRKLIRAGVSPVLEILCEVEEWEDANKIERDFIRWLSGASRLTNGTIGGDGGATVTGRKMPPRGPSPMRGIPWPHDDPRRAQIRLKQAGVAPMHATRKAVVVNTRRWRVTSPDGEVSIVHGLKGICEQYGLSASKMAAVASGAENRTQHKGWFCEKL